MEKVVKNSHRVPLPLVVMSVLISTLLFSALMIGKQSKLIDYYFQRRAEFLVRSWSNLEPDLNKKLKIFIYDDQAAIAHNSPQLSGDDWNLLLKGLAKKNPETIIIDKIFGYSKTSTSNVGEKQDNSFIGLEESNIAIAGFVIHQEIPGRSQLFEYWTPKIMGSNIRHTASKTFFYIWLS